MLGFGALRAMNDAMKQNRDNLKGNKKRPFNKDDKKNLLKKHHPATPFSDTKQLTDEERIRLIQSVKEEDKKEFIKRAILFMISILITIGLVIAFLIWIS